MQPKASSFLSSRHPVMPSFRHFAPAWKGAAAQPRLEQKQVHVWRANLQLDPDEYHRLEGLLSDEEMAEAARFQLPAKRQEYVTSRGVLRSILGGYLQLPPEQLRFSRNPQEKPGLAPGCSQPIHFNVSHSAGLALCAFTLDGEVGIDLEQIRTSADNNQVAERFFSPGEVARLRSSPPELQPEAFFTIWVCKEALLKATGHGIAAGLEQVEILLQLNEPQPQMRSHILDSSAWTLLSFRPENGFVGALAVRSHGALPSFWEWMPG